MNRNCRRKTEKVYHGLRGLIPVNTATHPHWAGPACCGCFFALAPGGASGIIEAKTFEGL